uniref:O-acyltransferase WSD1 C-terminal domain-containing protein n=1 Tax=Chaetoceros debilis TaxID=122233 RepID=A0A7S3Q980_9STRA
MNDHQGLEKDNKKSRRPSFTTQLMVQGTFPPSVNFQPPTINALISFEGSQENCPTEGDLVPVVEQLCRHHPRLSGIPTSGYSSRFSNFHFEPCDINSIDPKDMIRTVELDCDSLNDVIATVDEEVNVCLRHEERNLPWWEFVILSNKGKAESIVIFRADHAIGDGFSLGKVCTSILTNSDGSPVKDFVPEGMKSNKDSVLRQSKLVLAWKLLCGIGKTIILPLLWRDHKTAYGKNTLGQLPDSGNRKAFIFDPIPLPFLKEIKNAAECSLNDVLVAALSQAMNDYCTRRDCPMLKKHGDKIRCKAMLLVGFPSGELHNGWCPVPLDLGVGMKGPRDRIAHTHRTTCDLKSGLYPYCTMALQNIIMPILPSFLTRLIIHECFGKFHISFSNVPGPAAEVKLAGKKVSCCRVYVRHITSNFLALSYNNKVNIVLTADDEAISHVHLMPTLYMKGLVKIASEFGVAVPEDVQAAADKEDNVTNADQN